MKLKITFFHFFLFLFQLVFCQKEINDTLISKTEKNLVYQNLNVTKLINLKEDFNSEFYFRINQSDISIDLFKSKQGILELKSTQFYLKEKKEILKDTIIFSKLHNVEIALWLYNKIMDFKIDSITPFKPEGLYKSGIFMSDDYYLEFSNKEKYSIKSFPYSKNDTLSENYTLKNLIDELYDKIEIDKIKKDFFESLPNGYSYRKYVRPYFFKMLNSYLFTDFYGTYRLPLGIKSGYYVNKINKTSIKLNSSISFQKGFNENYSLKTTISKYSIFSKNTYFDGIHFNYEKNKLNYISQNSDFELKSIIYYGGFTKILNFGIGYTNFSPLENNNGFQISLSKNINSKDGFSNNITISPYLNFNFYKSITNYELGFETSYRIKLNKNSYTSFYTTLFLEKIYNYNSLNVSIYIPLKTFSIN